MCATLDCNDIGEQEITDLYPLVNTTVKSRNLALWAKSGEILFNFLKPPGNFLEYSGRAAIAVKPCGNITIHSTKFDIMQHAILRKEHLKIRKAVWSSLLRRVLLG